MLRWLHKEFLNLKLLRNIVFILALGSLFLYLSIIVWFAWHRANNYRKFTPRPQCECDFDKEIPKSSSLTTSFDDNFCKFRIDVDPSKTIKTRECQCSSTLVIQSFQFNIYDVIIVGSGFTGSILAYLHSRFLNHKVLVLEERSVVGGTCYDYFDEKGVLTSRYGLQVFHTNDERLWKFVNSIDEWIEMDYREIGVYNNTYFPFPFGIESVNNLEGLNIRSAQEMRGWKESKRGEVFEREFLKKFLRRYWGDEDVVKDKKNSMILNQKRIRENWEDRYYGDFKFQGIPKYGYNSFFARIYENENIDIEFNVDFMDLRDEMLSNYEKKIIYTGKIDRLFGYRYGKLPYRRVSYERLEMSESTQRNFQTNGVMSIFDEDSKLSRVFEYKHFPNQFPSTGQQSSMTIVVEFIDREGIDHMPMPDHYTVEMYEMYDKLKKNMENQIIFLGPLTKFKYVALEETLKESMVVFSKIYGRDILGNSDSGERKSKKPEMTVVICHCEENIDWILQFYRRYVPNFSITFVIFEKCKRETRTKEYFERKRGKFGDDLSYEVHVVANLGRESEAFLRFILYHSNSLGDVNFFFQGEKETVCDEKMNELIIEMSLKPHNQSVNVDLFREFNQFYVLNFFGSVYHWKNKVEFRKYIDSFCKMWNENIRQGEVSCEVESLENIVVSLRGEFVASKDLIHRVLGRYRNVLESFYCVLKKNDVLDAITWEQIWFSFFKGEGLFSQIRNDQLESICPCVGVLRKEDFFNSAINTYIPRFDNRSIEYCYDVMFMDDSPKGFISKIYYICVAVVFVVAIITKVLCWKA